jgi:hypothetical protein
MCWQNLNIKYTKVTSYKWKFKRDVAKLCILDLQIEVKGIVSRDGIFLKSNLYFFLCAHGFQNISSVYSCDI